MIYNNFDIRIRAESENRYAVYVNDSDYAEYLCDELLSPDVRAKLMAFEKNESNRQELKEVGLHLFNCLFRGTVLNQFHIAFGEVKDDESKGLRIRLRIQPPEIAALPWELLYDPYRARFLATWTKTPVTRFLKISEVNRQLAIKPPVRVLVAIPAFSGLAVDKEEKIVREAFKDLEGKKLVHLEFMHGKVSTTTIANKLDEGPPFHIFHFIGHGCFKKGEEDGYILVNPDGDEYSTEFVPTEFEKLAYMCAEDFADLFMNHPSMKLIVLNSCQGAQVSSIRPLAGVVPRLFGREIPAVVAMQYPILDEAALRFSNRFYRTLCKGYERGLIDSAITSARNLMHVKGRDDLSFATPVLFMRSESGAIFDLKDEPDEPTGVEEDVTPDALFKEPAKPATSFVNRFWRSLTAPVRWINDAPRLEAVRAARNETLAGLEKKKPAAQSQEELVSLQKEIDHEQREAQSLDVRLSRAVRATIAVAAIALVLSSAVFLASALGLLYAVDNYLQEKSAAYLRSNKLGGTALGDDQMRIVVVDETSVNGMPSQKPEEDRQYHVQMINGLARAGAKVIAIDIYLEGDTDWDSELAQSIKQAAATGTQVILGTYGYTPEGRPQNLPDELRELPDDHFGNVNVALLGSSPGLQWVKLGDRITSGRQFIAPSFILQAVRQFRRTGEAVPYVLFNKSDGEINLLNGPEELVTPIPVEGEAMHYYFNVPDDSTLGTVRSTYQDVLANRDRPGALQGFQGKLVMIGYRDEAHRVGTRSIPGVEVQAAIVANILQGAHLKKLTGIKNGVAILLLVGIGIILQTRKLRRFSIALPFLSPGLQKFFRIPLHLIFVTLLYLAVIYFIYSRTTWVVDISYHLVALVLSYWVAGFFMHAPHNLMDGIYKQLQPPQKPEVPANA